MSKPKQIQELVDSLEKERAEWESTARVLEHGNRYLTGDLERSRLEVRSLKKTVAQLKKQLLQLESQNQVKNQENVGGPVDNLIDNKMETELGGKGRSAMAVFPEEIWNMIFDKLKTTPEDLKSCSKVCVKFQEMLEPQRTVFLFDDVVKIINSSKVQNYRDTAPLTVPLTKCRRVCKAWKKAVDNRLLETNPIFPDYSSDPISNALVFSHSNNPWNNLEIRNLPENQNPMISHYLVYKGGLSKSNFWWRPVTKISSFLDFLRRFGQHVWYFKVDHYSESEESGKRWLETLCSFLDLMPNLKGLHLVKLNETSFPVYRDRYDSDYDYNAFEHDLSNSTTKFPKIPTMTALYFEDCDKMVVEAILKVNPQIQQLSILYDTYDGFETSSNFDFSNLSNLTELSLDCDGWTWTLVQNLTCNLTKLTLKALDLPWRSVFDVLEDNLENTLVELHLELSGAAREGALRLDLPNLKILGLKLERCSNSLDFVMNLMQLEHLRVDLAKMNDVPLDKIAESVQFHGSIYKLKYSNIWELLPNLKTVMARTDRLPEEPLPKSMVSTWQVCTRGEGLFLEY